MAMGVYDDLLALAKAAVTAQQAWGEWHSLRAVCTVPGNHNRKHNTWEQAPRPPQPRGIGKHMATKLFVGNLPHSTTDQGLNEFVTSAGFQVASAVVIRDKMTGSPRGFGFVELADGEDIQRAIAGLNGQALDGRPLTVNEARPPRTDFARPRGGGGRDNFSRRRDY
jgi:RNA recognition motif-containing protein